MPNPTQSPAAGRLNPSVPVYLATIQSDLKHVRASVPAGSLLWFLADLALQSVTRALKELDTSTRALNALGQYQGGTDA